MNGDHFSDADYGKIHKALWHEINHTDRKLVHLLVPL